jgi:predicted nuclease of predicted toxin-antitoxin system
VRFLTDNALSPVVAERLREAGHDAAHVLDYAMQAAPDEAVFEWARGGGRYVDRSARPRGCQASVI